MLLSGDPARACRQSGKLFESGTWAGVFPAFLPTLSRIPPLPRCGHPKFGFGMGQPPSTQLALYRR